MKAFFYFAPLFARQHKRLFGALLLSLVTMAAGIALLGLSGWFLTAAATTTAGAAFNLFAPSAGVRGLSFIRILSRYGEKLIGHDVTLRLVSDIRYWLFGKLFPILPLGRQHGRADIVSRLIADVEALDTVFLFALGPISTAILTGLCMSLGLIAVSPATSLIYAIAFFAATLGMPAALILLSRKASKEAVLATAALREAVLDSLDLHQDLVLFGQTAEAKKAATIAGENLMRARKRLGLYAALASAGVQCATAVAIVGMLLTGIPALSAGVLDGPLLVGLVLAVIASFEVCAVLVRSATRLAWAAAAAERLDHLAKQPPLVGEPKRPLSLPAGGNVSFECVTFGYDPQRPVITNLSFTIAAGNIAAIVGPSGVGKSTIAQLLARLYDPQKGTISLSGVDVRLVSKAEMHRHLALMTQDAPIFLDTVRENLLIGAPGASDAALWDVLRAVRLDGLVASLPQGLDSYLGERGLSLSAGQARRMCLARTLLSGAEVIVLDEPTSGLDRETERAFFADLPRLAGERTVIVITHAALEPGVFDTVLSLNAGRLLQPSQV